jgi:hypothetical protein
MKSHSHIYIHVEINCWLVCMAVFTYNPLYDPAERGRHQVIHKILSPSPPTVEQRRERFESPIRMCQDSREIPEPFDTFSIHDCNFMLVTPRGYNTKMKNGVSYVEESHID